MTWHYFLYGLGWFLLLFRWHTCHSLTPAIQKQNMHFVLISLLHWTSRFLKGKNPHSCLILLMNQIHTVSTMEKVVRTAKETWHFWKFVTISIPWSLLLQNPLNFTLAYEPLIVRSYLESRVIWSSSSSSSRLPAIKFKISNSDIWQLISPSLGPSWWVGHLGEKTNVMHIWG